jgi:alanyl-tRNA synthetase
MLSATETRQIFFDFFHEKGHKIIPSAPVVNKDDPTLMFTNAGMNQFKDILLGQKKPQFNMVANTQKCLRVSGKHNDLEEVGIDSYHHTLFEMLGNWSFGDYFKKEAITWAWELLTEKYGLDKDRLYASVFAGDSKDGLEKDTEAAAHWKLFLSEERILNFDKKDNFWEMGDTGPCGPCSEIHIDLRPEEERKKIPAQQLINKDHPQVIELWNLVFIQFNRAKDGKLSPLSMNHIDTGMGFERLCMALQSKESNYDTDIFKPIIDEISKLSGVEYTSYYDGDHKSDIAMRVVADHLRATSFAIADGQIPGNTGAGYVIRRILRRAVRYYYSFLDIREPLIVKLVPILINQFDKVFPELALQQDFIQNVIREEELSFLKTLKDGLARFENLNIIDGKIQGKEAFELYDTFGFPLDLTQLIAAEKGLKIDEEGFNAAMADQKARSRADAKKDVGDWEILKDGESQFAGYNTLQVDDAKILRYRKATVKGKDQYHVVMDSTPFYAESGGQVGDTGILISGTEKIHVLDTQKENELIVHHINKLPGNPELDVAAIVDKVKRRKTTNNHSATHLMHAALREVLGDHVQQRGSLVSARHLRFDFTHFQKVSEEEILEIEHIVNTRIRENISRTTSTTTIEEAKASGAMMLFGEKYGERVRMVTFNPEFSVELCGGCHVDFTGQIGLFKIISEGAISAGVRRIEAVTGDEAENFVLKKIVLLNQVSTLLRNPKDPIKAVSTLLDEIRDLKKSNEELMRHQMLALKHQLKNEVKTVNGISLLAKIVPLDDAGQVKDMIFQASHELSPIVILFGFISNDKPQLQLKISEELLQNNQLHAGNLIRELAKEIRGGGGGQPHYATAGGSDPAGLEKVIKKIEDILSEG